MEYKLEKIEAAAKLEADEQWHKLLDFSKQWMIDEPYNFIAWQSLGNSLRKLDRIDGAIRAFQEGIKVAPTQPIEFMGNLMCAGPLWYGLAHTYIAAGQNNLAIEAFREAACIEPTSADIWNDLGVVYTNSKDYQGAYEAFSRAINADPTNSNILKNFGIVCGICGIEQKVVSIYKALLKLDSGVAGELKFWVEKFQPQISLAEESTIIFSEAAIAYNSGDYAKAAILFKLLAEQGDAEAQYNLGRMYYLGDGVSADYREAAKWAKIAASNAATDELKKKCEELSKTVTIGKISKFFNRIAI